MSGERRENPHVQSYAVATDAAGMALLLADGKVFKCYEKFQDTIYHSELGASAVMLSAGYNLDCLMVCKLFPGILICATIMLSFSFSMVAIAILC